MCKYSLNATGLCYIKQTRNHVNMDRLLRGLAFDTAHCGLLSMLIAILSQGNTSTLVTILHLITSTGMFVMIVHGGLVRR